MAKYLRETGIILLGYALSYPVGANPAGDRNGTGAPPDLDTSTSIIGVDSNANGVRDDIESFIAARSLPDDQARAALQLANAFEATLLVDVADQQEVTRAAIGIARAIDCVYERFPSPDQSSNLVKRIEAQTFNTEFRTRTYIAFNVAFDGGVLKTTNKGACSDEKSSPS